MKLHYEPYQLQNYVDMTCSLRKPPVQYLLSYSMIEDDNAYIKILIEQKMMNYEATLLKKII